MAGRCLIRFLIVVLLGIALVAPGSGVAAQATPEPSADNPFANLGLPQLDITVSPGAYEGLPGELEAGQYVVSVMDNTLEQEGAGGAFLQIPEGMTMLDFLEFAMPAATGGEQGAPEASAVPDEAGDGPPTWYYETTIAGGPYVFSGNVAYAVVELTAGEWVFWAEYPGAPQAPVPIVVTGEMPVDLPAPEADVRIVMADFSFSFGTPLTAGSQIIELANAGDQPHFMLVAGVPDGTTADDIVTLIESLFAGPEASPAATPEGALTFEEVEDTFSTGDQSEGVTAWYQITLEEGTYAAICFVTDPESGLPHAMLGMIEVFDVS